jgi:ABC-type multidrug transport system fused ATPase/permease subunit
VCFEGVGFAYPGRAVPVLEELDLELLPGETVAVVGSSGAGKSTVAALALKLLQPTAGRIIVGGVDLAECDSEAWRRQVAWVPQHPSLLRGTIADNIRLGSADAGVPRVAEAAGLAGADGFVRGLPHGYETVVGEGARGLSPGERRRIALARALLRDAPLLILDEPTADLDSESAALVAEAVRRVSGRRTVLLIAHRPELVLVADRIITLERGVAVPHELGVAA